MNATGCSVVTGPDGQPKPDPPSPWPNRFALAATHPDVDEVLDIMGSPEPLGFVELFKVHEIIVDSIQPKKIHNLGWATKSDDSALTGSANRPDVERSCSSTRTSTGPAAEAHDDTRRGAIVRERSRHKVAGFAG